MCIVTNQKRHEKLQPEHKTKVKKQIETTKISGDDCLKFARMEDFLLSFDFDGKIDYEPKMTEIPISLVRLAIS